MLETVLRGWRQVAAEVNQEELEILVTVLVIVKKSCSTSTETTRRDRWKTVRGSGKEGWKGTKNARIEISSGRTQTCM